MGLISMPAMSSIDRTIESHSSSTPPGWESSGRLPIHEFRLGGAGTSLVATALRPFGSGIPRTAQDKTAIQRQVNATDRQIDKLVYELYGLTDDEIRIVEEATE